MRPSFAACRPRTPSGRLPARPAGRAFAAALALAAALASREAAPGAESPSSRLGAAVQAVLDRPELRSSTVGILFTRAQDGAVLYEHESQKLLAPASTTKLLSCAGALVTLGKDYRFETRLVATGGLVEGACTGDVVLVASGDPNLSQRARGAELLFADRDHSYAGFLEADLVRGDPRAVLDELARAAHDAGLRSVAGGVVVDDGLFSETEDDFVGAFSAACVNDKLVDVTVRPGAKEGAPAQWEHQPAGRDIQVTSSAVTGPEGAETTLWLEAREGIASWELMGSIAAGSDPVLRVASFRQPARVVASLLRDALERAKITIAGPWRVERKGPAAYREAPTLATHVSPPLSEAIKVVLKVSQNLHATMLPVLVGALRGGRGDRWSGYSVIQKALAAEGLDLEGISIYSGSGGGRGDQVTPRFLVDLLRTMARRDDFPVFLAALPVGGVDGTLASAFQGERFEGRVHAKTGTLVYRSALNGKWIYLSKALAGYILPRASREPKDIVAFAILASNTLASSRSAGSKALFRAQEDIVRAVLERVEGVEEGAR